MTTGAIFSIFGTADAEHGSDLVITRHRRPVAAVVGMSRRAELEEAGADLHDLALMLARALGDNTDAARCFTRDARI